MRGNLTQRGPNTWRLRVDAGGPSEPGEDGKRWQLTKTFHGTKRQAEIALAQFVAEAQEKRSTAAYHTLGELIDEWLKQAESLGRREATLKDYRKQQRLMPAWLLNIRLDRLTGRELDRFYTERLTEIGNGNGASAVAHHHRMLRAALRQGKRWHWIDTLPTDDATPPREKRQPWTYPKPDEVRALIAAAKASRHEDMALAIEVLARTGMRRAELCRLRWADVDLDRGVLSLGLTKTGEPREVALLGAILNRLQEHRDRAESYGLDVSPGAYVFTSGPRSNDALKPDSVTQFIDRLSRKLGLKVHTHSLRKFAVTYQIAAGIDVQTVAKRTGHDVSVLLDLYAGIVEERNRAADAEMERIIGL